MANLIIPGRLTPSARWTEPGVATTFNRASPQFRGLVRWWPLMAGDMQREMVTRTTMTPISEASIEPSPGLQGMGARGTAATTCFNTTLATGVGVNEGSYSVWVWARSNGAIGLGRIWSGDGGTSFLRFSDSGVGHIISGWGSGAPTATIPLHAPVHIAGTRQRNVGGGCKLYINGLVVASVLDGGGDLDTSAIQILNRGASSGNDRGMDGWVSDLRFYSHIFTEADVWRLYSEPFDLYTPLQRRIFKAAAAAGLLRRLIQEGLFVDHGGLSA